MLNGCPVCSEHAPPELNHYQRWRWYTVHITQHKK